MRCVFCFVRVNKGHGPPTVSFILTIVIQKSVIVNDHEQFAKAINIFINTVFFCIILWFFCEREICFFVKKLEKKEIADKLITDSSRLICTHWIPSRLAFTSLSFVCDQSTQRFCCTHFLKYLCNQNECGWFFWQLIFIATVK